MNGVQIIDTVVLPGDRVAPWLREWRTGYLPGARARGMVAERVWRSWTGPDTAAVRVLWSLPDSGSFFAARAAAGADPRIAEFWARTDELALSRERHVLDPVDLGEEGVAA
ncbi:NIPSNAP family protein [Streptomyces sp. NPDC052101]|uniref:NIPSNAP family protein n=1 Tax=Streptomyces sp. NPDC052101 TaxID=3155763 RepID=UPI003449844D